VGAICPLLVLQEKFPIPACLYSASTDAELATTLTDLAGLDKVFRATFRGQFMVRFAPRCVENGRQSRKMQRTLAKNQRHAMFETTDS
jgi:hypothetical protein